MAVTRPEQTDTEGLKLPVVYVTSPYFAGTSSTDKEYMWNPQHELGASPPERKQCPPGIKPKASGRPFRDSHIRDWVPRVTSSFIPALPGPGFRKAVQPSVATTNRWPPRR